MEFRAACRAALSGALLLLALTAFTPEALPQKRTRALEQRAARSSPKSTPPRFSDYPVREIYRGAVAPVILDTRRAREFRTRLREDSRAGTNFAGHYAVVFWGCGTGCAQVAVVDVRTGRVYWPPVDYVDVPAPTDETPAAEHPNFRPDSKLLVLARNHYDGRGGHTVYYYLFDRNRFRLLRRAEERDPEPEDSTQ